MEEGEQRLTREPGKNNRRRGFARFRVETPSFLY
jgi:hypothetical protein